MNKTPSRHRARSEAKTPLTPSLIDGINSLSLASMSKTPSRQRTRSDAKTPLTPSLIAGLNAVSLAPSKSLQKQAGEGVIRKGGVESRLDVVTLDYIPQEPKRSRSTPATNRDRFITQREDQDRQTPLDMLSHNPLSSSPGHTARLVQATGVPLNRRILGFHEQPPLPSSDTTLNHQRELARPLYARPGALPSSTGATTNKSRKFPTQPERVLDAPGMVDDFYLNLLSWSCQNILAVALEASTYIWKADTGTVAHLADIPDSYVSSVDFSNDGMFLGVGLGTGDCQLWDIETNQKLRSMSGHQAQVACLSWHQHILSSGCGDGSIWHHDVRVPRHKVMELLGHSGEVCGLKWRTDGEMLASGGNDNVVNIWDGRIGESGPQLQTGVAKWTKRNHTAAVKAIAWCPWQPSLLASGGGTNDATVNVWNTTTGARLHTLKTPSQVTSIIWSPHRKEFATTHGYPTNALMVHAYPSMERLAEIRDAHDCRVLFSCLGPAGDVICTGAGDENLKFWRIWDAVDLAKKKKDTKEPGRLNSTKEGILAIR